MALIPRSYLPHMTDRASVLNDPTSFVQQRLQLVPIQFVSILVYAGLFGLGRGRKPIVNSQKPNGTDNTTKVPSIRSQPSISFVVSKYQHKMLESPQNSQPRLNESWRLASCHLGSKGSFSKSQLVFHLRRSYHRRHVWKRFLLQQRLQSVYSSFKRMSTLCRYLYCHSFSMEYIPTCFISNTVRAISCTSRRQCF